MEIIKSRWILDRVVASANIKDFPEIRKQSDPADWLTKKVSVNRRGDSNLFEIKYASPDRGSSAVVVNEVTRQYLLAQEEEERSRFNSILAALNQQLTAREDNVRTLRQQVEAAAQKVSGEEPEQEQGREQGEPKPLGKSRLAEMQGRLIEVQVEKAMLSARIKAAEEEISVPKTIAAATTAAATSKAAAGNVGAKPAAPTAEKSKRELTNDEKELRDQMVERELEVAPDVMKLKSQLFAERLAMKRLEKQLKDAEKDPMYKKHQQEITIGKSSLEDLKKTLRPEILEQVEFALRNRQVGGVAGPDRDAERLERRQEELSRLKVELRGCDIAEENLRSAYSTELTKALKNREQLSGESLNLKFKKDELAEAQTVLAKISDRLIQMQTERSAPPRVIWHMPAKVPEVPIEELPLRNMFVAGLPAFFLPFALAIAWEVRARRISFPGRPGAASASDGAGRDRTAADASADGPAGRRDANRLGSTDLRGKHRQPAERR